MDLQGLLQGQGFTYIRLNRYKAWATVWTAEESGLHYQQGQDIFLFSSVKPGFGSHPVPYTMRTTGSFSNNKSDRSMKLTTHLHLCLG
jgi:hypothetical protein